MPYKITPSTLHILDDCPRCFWLQFNKDIKRPEGIFPSLPSGMDKVLKDYFDVYSRKKELPPELQDEKDLSGAKIFDDLSLLARWRNNRVGIQLIDERGNILKGAVDALLIKDGKLIVLDYKTRGYPLKEDTHTFYQDQLDIYNLLLRKNGHMTHIYSYLLFYHPNKVTDKGVLFNSDLIKLKVNVDNAEKKWKHALDVLEGPMPEASDKCEYCRYRNIKIEKTLSDF